MAKVTTNSALKTLRGAMGDTVFKTYRRGKRTVVIMTRRARMDGVIWSDKQQQNRARMQRAGEFYRAVVADPAVHAFYQAAAQKKGVTVPALTLRDFFRTPCVSDFNLSAYTGRPGDELAVSVTDALEAHEAVFSVRTLAGEVRESGKGRLTSYDNTQFVYRATSTVAPGETVVLEVVVTDRPGNAVVASVKWTNAPAPFRRAKAAAAPAASLRYEAEDFRAG